MDYFDMKTGKIRATNFALKFIMEAIGSLLRVGARLIGSLHSPLVTSAQTNLLPNFYVNRVNRYL